MNSVKGKQLKVGAIKATQLSMTSQVIFPDGLSTPPIEVPIPIKVGLASNENPSFAGMQVLITPYALKDFKLSTRSHVIESVVLNECGLYDSVQGYSQCLASVRAMKVPVILLADIGPAVFYQKEWQVKSGLFIPSINVAGGADVLGSNADYPCYNQLTQSARYLFINEALYYKAMRASKIHFIDSNAASFEIIEKLNTEANIEIVTPRSFIPSRPRDPDFCKEVAKSVKDSNLRFVFISELDPMDLINCYLVEFANIGLLSEDIQILTWFGTYLTLHALANEDERAKLEEYRDSILQMTWHSFIGEIGKRLETEFPPDSLTWGPCFIYDEMAYAITAIDFALVRGYDLYNPFEMNRAIKSVRLVGCSGVTTFSKENNFRRDVDIMFLQSQEVDGVLQDVKVLLTSLSGSSVYTKLREIVWADSVTGTHSMYRLNYVDCPFPEEYRRGDQPDSQRQEAYIVLGLFGFTVVIAVVAYFWLYRGVTMHPVVERFLPATQDMIIFMSTFADVLLIGLLTPEFGPVNFLMLNYPAMWSLRIDLGDGNLFSVLHASYAFMAIGAIIAILCAANHFKPFRLDLQIFAVIIIRPLFIPLTYILFSVFSCSKAAAESTDTDMYDAYMDGDCNESCWEGKHLRYSAASAVAFAVYSAVAASVSPNLCNTLEGLQFETSPKFLILRIPVLTLFVALLNTSKLMSPELFYGLYLTLLGLYSLLCIKLKALAVPTIDLLHNASLLLMLLFGTCLAVYVTVYNNFNVLYGVGMACSAVLGTLAYFRYRKFPKFFLKPPQVNEAEFFKFAFRPNERNVPKRFYEAEEQKLAQQLDS
jgi:hypothetical protein